VLPIGRDEYLSLVDWTGREIRAGKRGAIPAHLAGIMDRIPINQARWVDTVQGYGGMFRRVVGGMETLMDRARFWGMRRLGGFFSL